ncbi:MAG: hypothetical protein WA117_10185 [Verrucomicrobiia bacterium]
MNNGEKTVTVAQVDPSATRLLVLRRRLVYGNRLPWVCGDYTAELKTLGEMVGLRVEVIS